MVLKNKVYPRDSMKNLTDLANSYGTDKGSLIGNKHCYTYIYDELFSSMKMENINLLEIGLSIGGPELGYSATREVLTVPSVEMWLSYFPNGSITGLDISDCSHFKKDRFSFIQCDCGDQVALKKAASGREFDFVIDDGSHASFHQQLTMLEFFSSVKPGGYYIIEDLDWQPEDYERELPPVAKMSDMIEWFKHSTICPSYGLFAEEKWLAIREQIDSIKTYRLDELESLKPEELKEKYGFIEQYRRNRRKRHFSYWRQLSLIIFRLPIQILYNVITTRLNR